MEKPIQFIGKDMPEEISFGKWLRQRRRTLDLTQKALADQIGCAEITVRQIEADALKPSKELAEIILERLGISESERLGWIAFARGISGYPQKTESRSSQPEQKTNLSIPLTSFVGRQSDVERVKQRLARHRLVTLIGAGGIGKTRLAQQVGRQILEEYPNGVWLVELASLTDPTLVPQTVATVFDIQPQSNRPIVEILIQALRGRTTLLILDNCEHLLDACAQLADKLLKHCPNLNILATSREALSIIGEALYPVPSLTIPRIQRIESAEKLKDYESVRLFDERAKLAQMDFALTKENASSIARICSRLDGIPLAIELAAARINTLQVEEILKQLNVCFSVLASHSRTELPRHQTLRASMDWSWNLLNDSERILLRRLSVFAGGWTLEVAESVCCGNGIEPHQVSELVSQLVAKSLVVVHRESGRERRYRLLEMIRQYARERLIKANEEENLRNQHLKYFLKLSEVIEPGLIGPQQMEWLARANDECDNFRAALEQASKIDVEGGLHLASRLSRFWEQLDLREGARWLSEFLQRPESHAYPRIRAKALLVQGAILYGLRQFDAAQISVAECLELFRSCGEQQGEIDGLLMLSRIASYVPQKVNFNQRAHALALAKSLGDLRREADALLNIATFDKPKDKRTYEKAAIALLRQLGDWSSLAGWLGTLGLHFAQDGDVVSAQKYLDESKTLSRQLNIKASRELFSGYSQIALIHGDYEKARAYLQEGATISEEHGDWIVYIWYRVRLGHVSLREGNLSEARDIFVDTAQIFQKEEYVIGVVFTLEGMASLNVSMGKPERAARLIGWADATRKKIGDTRPLLEQKDVDKIVAACITKMGESAFSDAYDEGQKMTLDEAVAYALEKRLISPPHRPHRNAYE